MDQFFSAPNEQKDLGIPGGTPGGAQRKELHQKDLKRESIFPCYF
jgi:hypothetical protein